MGGVTFSVLAYLTLSTEISQINSNKAYTESKFKVITDSASGESDKRTPERLPLSEGGKWPEANIGRTQIFRKMALNQV